MADTVEKNPLISIYQSLDKSECRRLGKWLDSPAHNQRDDVRALHAYLTGDPARLYKTSALAKKRIWRRIFPDAPFDDAKLRQTFHWALRAAESFVAYTTWKASAMEEQLFLATGLRQRGLATATARSLKRAEQLQAKRRERNEGFYHHQFRLEQERDEYRVYHDILEQPNFQEIADNLDLTYLIEKLKVSCNMLFQARAYRTEYDVRFLEETIAYVRRYDLARHPVLAIYYYVYRGLTEPDESGENIGLLRDTLERHGDRLNAVGRRYVILMAINICISNLNRGQEAFVRESFEWYRLGLSADVIAKHGQLTRETYLNIFSIAVRLSEFAFAEDFLENFAHQLDEDIRENTQRFARARLGYERQDYDTAMPLLVRVDFKHPVYNLLAKTLLLKIYYELDEYDALESQVDSMTTYVRRKELSDLHRDNFKNVARLTRQLSRLNPRNRKKREELHQRITETAPLSEKKWLLAQIERL